MGAIKTWLNNRKEVKLAKQETKQHKSDNRTASQIVAYQNGIDPKKAWADATGNMVTGLFQSAGGALSSIYGFGNSPGLNKDPKVAQANALGKADTNNKALLVVVFVAVIALIFGGK